MDDRTLILFDKDGNEIVTKILFTYHSDDFDKNYVLINIETGLQYKNNELIRNTDIKNGCKLILV